MLWRDQLRSAVRGGAACRMNAPKQNKRFAAGFDRLTQCDATAFPSRKRCADRMRELVYRARGGQSNATSRSSLLPGAGPFMRSPRHDALGTPGRFDRDSGRDRSLSTKKLRDTTERVFWLAPGFLEKPHRGLLSLAGRHGEGQKPTNFGRPRLGRKAAPAVAGLADGRA